MSNEPEFGFVVEYVQDIEAAQRFYVDVLGLRVQRYHPTFIQFDHFAIASDAPMDGSGESELYWLVEDAAAAFKELSQKAEVIAAPEQKPFGTVFSVKDPDGRPRYLLQLARERPSQTVG